MTCPTLMADALL